MRDKNKMKELRKIVDYQKKIRENKKRCTILFADLADSTAYKILKPTEEAQVKIYVHNDIVTQGVQAHEGMVIKYLGDGVMAMFQGGSVDKNAVNAAITIQKDFNDYNNERGLKDFDKIQSKIGINSGDVFLWDYVPEGDPQGTTVDVASRITDLAKPDQILCSATCKKECSGKTAIRFGETVDRELKGVIEKIGICEVIWQNELKIDETMHISPLSDRIKSFLQRATKGEEQGEYISAIGLYKEILQEDPQHFLANLKLGLIIYTKPQKLGRKYTLDDALKFAKNAKESNPWSGNAKNLYATILWAIKEESLSDEILDELIKEAKSAMVIFKNELDQYGALSAANNLAYYYGERYNITKEKKYIDEAIKLCKNIETEYTQISISNYAGFLDTYGFLLSKRMQEGDLKKAHELLKRAEGLAANQYIYGHLHELDKKAKEHGISLETNRED